MPNGASLTQRLLRWFDIVIVAALQVLLIMLIVIATLTLYGLFLLGLELMETLKTYFSAHHIRVEVILVVAIIAVGRHIIKLDFEHVSASLLFGLAALTIALAAGYFLVRSSHSSSEK